MTVSKKTPSSRLLLCYLLCPAGEAEAAQRMVGAAGRDCVRLPAALLDWRERFLPARPDADVEPGLAEPHVGAHDSREQDVADLVVDGVRPLDPVLLHQDTARARAARRPPRPASCGSTARRRSRRACRSPARARPRRGTPASASCYRRTRGPSCSPRASPRSRPRRRGARSAAPAGAPATGRTAAAPARSCPDLAAQSRVAYSTFSKGQSDSTHPLTALHSGASRSASLARTQESTCASTPSVETG